MFVYFGYRGVEVPNVIIYKARQKRGVNTRRLKRTLKRRNAIEPIIEHLKNDSNYLKGEMGDALHAILCGVGHNIRLSLRRLSIFLPYFWQLLSRFCGILSAEQILLAAKVWVFVKISVFSGATSSHLVLRGIGYYLVAQML